MISAQMSEDFVDLVPGQNDRHPGRPLRSLDVLEPTNFLLEDFLVEKQQCAQRLVLGGGSNSSVPGKMGQELADFVLRHFLRMALSVKQNKPLDPVDIGLLGSD